MLAVFCGDRMRHIVQEFVDLRRAASYILARIDLVAYLLDRKRELGIGGDALYEVAVESLLLHARCRRNGVCAQRLM